MVQVHTLKNYYRKSNWILICAHLAAYVRSGYIYKIVYKENIEGRTEILAKVSGFISTVNRIKYEQRKLSENLMFSKGDVKMIEIIIFFIKRLKI